MSEIDNQKVITESIDDSVVSFFDLLARFDHEDNKQNLDEQNEENPLFSVER